MLLDAVDVPRLLACATDQARHDRMLDITGGDTAALTEVTDVQDQLLRLEEPDLPALARLNVHRSLIADRNAHVPTILPAVWATLGYPERGEALAQAILEPYRRGEALAGLAWSVAENGDLDQAEALARAIADGNKRDETLAGLAQAVADAGHPDRAEAMAREVADPRQREQALAALARRAASAGIRARPRPWP